MDFIKTEGMIKILSFPPFCKWFLLRKLVNIRVSYLLNKSSVKLSQKGEFYNVK